MADREKVIKGLEICSHIGWCVGDNDCPYWRNDLEGKEQFDLCKSMLSDALVLLKEQEAKSVESIQMDRSDKWGADLSGYCPSCKRPLKNRFNTRFCGECGQEVKWDE